MTLKSKAALWVVGWLVLITGLHAWLNVNWAAVLNDYRPLAQRKITVAYLPVTCQLTCPVTDYISKYSLSGEMFLPKMFQGFPEMKEALISNRVQAAFVVAPLAIALVSQGVPIKVVYLGHRYGSAVVVRKDGPIKTFADMRGRTIAIPSRFSDERLLLFRAMKVWGIKPGEIKMVEMAPPDVSERARCPCHRRLCHGGALSIASRNWRLWTSPLSGPRVLAGLYVLHSRRAPGPH